MYETINRKNTFSTIKNARFKMAIDFINGGRKYFPSEDRIKDYKTNTYIRDEGEGLIKLLSYKEKTKGKWNKVQIFMADNLPGDPGTVPSERINHSIKISEERPDGYYQSFYTIKFKTTEINGKNCNLVAL